MTGEYYVNETQRNPAPGRRVSRPFVSAVKVIIGINIVVFFAWWAARTVPGLGEFMVNNFLVSSTRLMQGRWWTLVTSAFSHAETWHLAINMFVLFSFGTVLERLWGTRDFVFFYLVAAVVGSLSHCFVSSVLVGVDALALGASGAVSGLLMAFALLYPRHKILLFFFIPIPALFGVLAFVALDIWGLIAKTQGGGLPIGHGAHLGGALAGAVMYFAYLRTKYPAQSLVSSRPPTVASLLSLEEAAEFERLRTKIEAEGPHSLTPKEQDFLSRIRERVMQAHQQHPSGPD